MAERRSAFCTGKVVSLYKSKTRSALHVLAKLTEWREFFKFPGGANLTLRIHSWWDAVFALDMCDAARRHRWDLGACTAQLGAVLSQGKGRIPACAATRPELSYFDACQTGVRPGDTQAWSRSAAV